MKMPRHLDSMTGRLFLLLVIGVIGSALLALGLASARRRADLDQINLAFIANRVQDFVSIVNSAPPSLRAAILAQGIPGLHTVTGRERAEAVDPRLTAMLAARQRGTGRIEQAAPASCIAQPSVSSFYAQINCWLIPVQLADGTRITLAAFSPRSFEGKSLDPIVFSILTLAVGLLAFLAARMAAAPLRDLSRAARALGSDLDRSPLPERGPFEVRDAIRAFNAMQARLRDAVAERTRILASITHDLQTPLTRLRLRLERVGDAALRSRLIDDLGGMQVLIRQGLDLCRGNRIEEPFARVALDSLLESVVEDAAAGGRSAVLVQRCGYDVEAQPGALQRCLANLIDNALKYGGSAEVVAQTRGGAIYVSIRDFGPGIPPDQLQAVFEPFVRLEPSSSSTSAGIGLGLTIAQTLAQQNSAQLILRNHPDGGLEASLILTRGLVPSHGAPTEPVSGESAADEPVAIADSAKQADSTHWAA